jgi:pimeloyl-ACP methyl ester carboxylesterase
MATQIVQRCYYPQGVIRQMAAVITDGSRVDRLKTINVPFLVVHGDSDALLQPVCGEDIVAHVPDAGWHLIDGMGHDIGPGLEQVIGPHVANFMQLA